MKRVTSYIKIYQNLISRARFEEDKKKDARRTGCTVSVFFRSLTKKVAEKLDFEIPQGRNGMKYEEQQSHGGSGTEWYRDRRGCSCDKVVRPFIS